MSEKICDDSFDYEAHAVKIMAMTDEEFEAYIAEMEKNNKK